MKNYNDSYHSRIQSLIKLAMQYPHAASAYSYDKHNARDKRRMLTALREDILILFFIGTKFCYLFSGNANEYTDMKCWCRGTVEELVANDCNTAVESLPNWVIDNLQDYADFPSPMYEVILSEPYNDKITYVNGDYSIKLGGIALREYDTLTREWKQGGLIC
jgi:hypothetical protein